jgi:hypothetical protein
MNNEMETTCTRAFRQYEADHQALVQIDWYESGFLRVLRGKS